MNIKILKSRIMEGLRWIFFLTVVILGLRVGLIHSLKEPISPSSPKSPVLEGVESKKRVGGSVKKKDLLYSYRVRIILNGGTEIEGRIKLKGKSLMVKREEEGIIYRKGLEYKLIKSIRMKEWKGYRLNVSGYRKKEAVKGREDIPYLFYPLIYEIRKLDNEVLIHMGRIKELEVMELKNGFGSTRVYGIFYDYWVRRSINLKGGYWANSGSKHYKRNGLNPNALAIGIIYFLKSQ